MVSIQRQVLQASGTVTGIVVKVHNDFWIELKPRRGVADAFAPGANYNDKEFMAKLRALKPGDSVTIQFTTDFERHRIVTLRKNAVPGATLRSMVSPLPRRAFFGRDARLRHWMRQAWLRKRGRECQVETDIVKLLFSMQSAIS